MEVSVLPSDRRRGFVGEVPESILRTLDVMESLPRKREEIALRQHDQSAVRNAIMHHMLEYKHVQLPPAGWYVIDSVPDSNIFLIRAVDEFNVGTVGFIPYKYDNFQTPFWDGMIIDLDDPEFEIGNIFYTKGFITEQPLEGAENEIIFKGFVQQEDNMRRGISFQGDMIITPYLEAPHLRVWRKNGVVYCSNRSRINALDVKASHTKSYRTIWQELSGDEPSDLFEGVDTDDYYFIMQVCAPELLPYTHTVNHGIVRIGTLSVRATEEPIPILDKPIMPIYDIETANNWLGFNNDGDPRLNGGNAIVIIDRTKNVSIVVCSHAYAWRADLIGHYDSTFSWPKRYLEICNSRFLNEQAYLSIFPVVIDEPMDKASARLKNISMIWNIISPPHLKADTENIYENFWGENGVIAQLANFVADPEKMKLIEPHRRSILISSAENYRRSLSKKGGALNNAKLYKMFFTNSKLQKPHIFGEDLYPVIRKMRNYEKTAQFYEKKKAQS